MTTKLWRLQRTLLLGVGVWGFFGMLHFLRGYPVSGGIDMLMALGTGFLWLMSKRWRIDLVANLSLGIAILGLVLISLVSGQARAVAIWWVAAVPVVAAYQMGAEAGMAWGRASALAILILFASEWAGAVRPEFVPDALEVTVSRLILVLIVTVFAVHNRRMQDKSLKAVEVQARELAKVRDEALLSAESKSRFLANMSHELRTPLNAVVGLTQALAGTPLSAEQRSWVETVSRSSELLLGIVNDILDFSKLEADQLALESLPLVLETSLFQAADLVAGQAWKKGLDLAVQIDPATPSQVQGDPLRLEQVLLNLLSNAIKFTTHGEVVMVVRPLPNDEGIEFEVRDTGVGIPPERMDKLFRPFGQLDASISRRFGGTGLGLAISQRLTARMGGQLEVKSIPTQGSVFSLRLPLKPVEGPLPPSRLEGSVGCAGVRPASREALERIITPWGMTLVEEGGDWILVDARQQDLQLPPGAHVLLLPVGEEAIRGQLGIPAWVRYPLRPAALLELFQGRPRPEPVEAVEVPLGDVHPLRILVAEDNLVNQKVARVLLRRLGYDCDVVGNGQQAVEAVRGGDYDMVLMDLQMPVMDGLEATRLIRQERGERPQVVVVTADVLPDSRERMDRAGADGFLAKPLTLKELRQSLEACPPRVVAG